MLVGQGFGGLAHVDQCPLSADLARRFSTGYASGTSFVAAVQRSMGQDVVELMAAKSGELAGPLMWTALAARFDCLRQVLSIRC